MSKTISKKMGALNAWLELYKASTLINKKTITELSSVKITLPQFFVLDALVKNGEMNVGQLCETMYVSGGNLTLVLDNLQKMNYVERTINKQDRRSLNVKLTKEGKKAYDKASPVQEKAISTIFSVLTVDELKKLTSTLAKLSDAVSK